MKNNEIMVKFKNDDRWHNYTKNILIDLMCDSNTEYIMDGNTGEIIYMIVIE
jgi:hypothetical protein